MGWRYDEKTDEEVWMPECMICGEDCNIHALMCDACLEAAVESALHSKRMIKRWPDKVCKVCEGTGDGWWSSRDPWSSPEPCEGCDRTRSTHKPSDLAALMPDGLEADSAALLVAVANTAKLAAEERCAALQKELDAAAGKQALIVKLEERAGKLEADLAQKRRELADRDTTLKVLRQELGLIRVGEGEPFP